MESTPDAKSYLEQVLIPNFRPLINQNIYSVLCDLNYEAVICTNLSARSLVFTEWHQMVCLSYKLYNGQIAKARNRKTPDHFLAV